MLSLIFMVVVTKLLLVVILMLIFWGELFLGMFMVVVMLVL